MSLVDQHRILRSHFIDNWPEDVITVFDNQPNIEIDDNETFCRFSIQSGSSDFHGRYGDKPLFKTLGRLYLQILIPDQKGVKEANNLADTFADILRNKTFSETGLTIYTYTPELSQSYDENRFILRITIRYEAFSEG